LDMDCLILLLHISVNHWSLVRHDLLLLLPSSGPASHTQTRPTTGTEAECDRLDYQSYRAHALRAPDPRVNRRCRPSTIPAIHPALFVEADSAEEYSEYRLRAISHPRAPLINIPRASILVAPSYKLRPCSPSLPPHGPGRWRHRTLGSGPLPRP